MGRSLEEKIAAYRRKKALAAGKDKPWDRKVVPLKRLRAVYREIEEKPAKERPKPWSKKVRVAGEEVTRRVEAAMRERLAAETGPRKSAAELERERFRVVAGKFALSEEEERERLGQIARRLNGA